jgi:hypothetical protein
MDKIYNEITYSVMVKLLSDAHQQNLIFETPSIFHNRINFRTYLTEKGIPLLKEHLVRNQVPLWAVESLVDNSKTTELSANLINLFDLIHKQKLFYTTGYNDGMRWGDGFRNIISDEIRAYLMSDRRDLDHEVKQYLLNYGEILQSFGTSEKHDYKSYVLHPIFQDLAFIQSRTQVQNEEHPSVKKGKVSNFVIGSDEHKNYESSLCEQGPSILQHLMYNLAWYSTELGKKFSTYEQNIWMSYPDEDLIYTSPIPKALSDQPFILLKQKSQISNKEEYRNQTLKVFLDNPRLVNESDLFYSLTVMNSYKSKQEPYDVAFLAHPEFKNKYPFHDLFTHVNSSQFIIDAGLDEGYCGLTLIYNSCEGEQEQKEARLTNLLENFKTKAYINKISDKFVSFAKSGEHSITRAYAYASTVNWMSSFLLDDKLKQLKNETKEFLLETLQNYLYANPSKDFSDVKDMLQQDIADLCYSDEMSAVANRVNFSVLNSTRSEIEAEQAPKMLY